MTYSITDESVKKMLSIEQKAIDDIVTCYNDYSNALLEWVSRINSDLFLNVAKTTLDDYSQIITTEFIKHINIWNEKDYSIYNISKRYFVGEDAIYKVNTIVEKLRDIDTSVILYNLEYNSNGQANFSAESINQYKEISDDFKRKLQECFDDLTSSNSDLIEENMLCESVMLISHMHFNSLLNACRISELVFGKFMEWFESIYNQTNQRNESFAKIAKGWVTNILDSFGLQELIQRILHGDDTIEGSDSSIGSIETKEHNNSQDECSDDIDGNKNDFDEIEQNKTKFIEKYLHKLCDTLNSSEKIHKFLSYVYKGKNIAAQCLESIGMGDFVQKARNLSIYLKDGYKKYGKPLMEALSTIVPMFANDPISYTICKAIPKIADSLSGNINNPDDVTYASLGLEMVDAINIGDSADAPENLSENIHENISNITEKIISLITTTTHFKNLLGLDAEIIDQSPMCINNKINRGEVIKEYPRKFDPYNGHNFMVYKPEKLNKLTLSVDATMLNNVDNVAQSLSEIYGNDIDNLYSDFTELLSNESSDKGYVDIDDKSLVGKFIKAANAYLKLQGLPELLKNKDGRYNKGEVKDLYNEIMSASNNMRENISKNASTGNTNKKTVEKIKRKKNNLETGIKNFARRQYGYPTKNSKGVLTANNLKNLIPIIDNETDKFQISDCDERQMVVKYLSSKRKTLSAKNKSIGIVDLLLFGFSLLFGPFFTFLYPSIITDSSTGNEEDDIYIKLSTEIGSDRADKLSEKYTYDINEELFKLRSSC